MSSDWTRRLRAQWAASGRLETLLVFAAFHIPLTLVFAAVLVKSMSWETAVDSPMFMYTGFLMDHFGMAPMRDYFTYNMPGTHVVFRWLYHFFGASILGMRLADTAVLAVVLVLYARLLKPFGFRAAWAGTVLFGLVHITLHLNCYLQRDFIALVPLQLAMLSASAWFEGRPRSRWFATGLFVGVLSTIKPHLMFGGLVLYGYLVLQSGAARPATTRDWAARALRVACWCAAGGCVPVLWMAGYLTYYGQLGAFIKVLVDYFPMHADVSDKHRIFLPGEKLGYTISHLFGFLAWNLHYQMALAAGAGLALFAAAPTVPQHLRRYGGFLVCMAVAYLIYPALAARFYDHHYYAFYLLYTVWVAFCLYGWDAGTPVRVRLFALAAAAYAIVGTYYVNYDELMRSPGSESPYYRTARIAQWLRPRLEPGDTVQGIEWAFCGIAHAFLEAKAKPATHTIWGEVLYHHVSTPFVQGLRKDFMDQMRAAKPRFVVCSMDESDFVQGTDTTMTFPEFESFLGENYFPALDTRDFRIWEINTSPTAAADRERHKPFEEEEGSRRPGRLGPPIWARHN